MLTTDGVFRLINCDKVAAGGRPVVERCWKLDLSGSFPEAAPRRRPDAVDFSFAPADGWGTFTVYFLAKTGDIHAMCPVAPRGAKYPRVTLKHLDVADEAAASLVERDVFELADTRVPMLAAHVQKDEDRPVALQGPLPRSMKTSARDGSASEDALSIAVSPRVFRSRRRRHHGDASRERRARTHHSERNETVLVPRSTQKHAGIHVRDERYVFVCS